MYAAFFSKCLFCVKLKEAATWFVLFPVSVSLLHFIYMKNYFSFCIQNKINKILLLWFCYTHFFYKFFYIFFFSFNFYFMLLLSFFQFYWIFSQSVKKIYIICQLFSNGNNNFNCFLLVRDCK